MVRILLLLLSLSAARAERIATPELDTERDALIDKIARGVDVEVSVRRFKQIVE